jgi:hypothetical protein
VTVYRSKGCVPLSSGGFGACVKLVRCAAVEAVGLAVAACVKAEGGGQANLPEHYARLAGMLVILHRLRLEVNGE